ncbi:hypothetical protein JCM33374_g4092 [Metschnikowia sp. JCM 33374]|nr:hypothetical protein JCM33374_g4092 [Metschnikowia sp. JCM 33374]
MLQARQLGKELVVGVHSDEEILHNKGPVVMKLDERLAAVNACKWVTETVGDAPYVTEPEFMAKYGCKYVVHGDDITTDANGEDCYKGVKEKGMFVVVKRTPDISTTDLVARMLLVTKSHHFPSIDDTKSASDHVLFQDGRFDRFKSYATDVTGHKANAGVYAYCAKGSEPGLHTIVEPSEGNKANFNSGNNIYIDGAFDLFHAGHIAALRLMREEADKTGSSVFVGLHDDDTVNEAKGKHHPIMSIYERALCVLSCRYVDAIIIGAPHKPTVSFLKNLPGGKTGNADKDTLPVVKVFHGPTPVDHGLYDEVPHIFHQLPDHRYSHVTTDTIVNRVMGNRKAYEERQARKGWKSETEKKLKAAELGV